MLAAGPDACWACRQTASLCAGMCSSAPVCWRSAATGWMVELHKAASCQWPLLPHLALSFRHPVSRTSLSVVLGEGVQRLQACSWQHGCIRQRPCAGTAAAGLWRSTGSSRVSCIRSSWLPEQQVKLSAAQTWCVGAKQVHRLMASWSAVQACQEDTSAVLAVYDEMLEVRHGGQTMWRCSRVLTIVSCTIRSVSMSNTRPAEHSPRGDKPCRSSNRVRVESVLDFYFY